MNDRLYRSVDDRVVAGVAGGLAERMGLDPSLVRIIWALLIIASSGVFLVIYIIMAIVVPEEEDLGGFSPMPPPAGVAYGFGAPAPTDPAGQPVAGAAPSPGPSGWASAPGPTTSQLRSQVRAQRRAAREARRAQHGPGRGGVVVGVVLILLGAWFLLREYVPEIDFDRVWPFLLLAIGVGMLVFSFGGRGGDRGGGGAGGGPAGRPGGGA